VNSYAAERRPHDGGRRAAGDAQFDAKFLLTLSTNRVVRKLGRVMTGTAAAY
jgi:hypothetical protein